jgi:putative transposase
MKVFRYRIYPTKAQKTSLKDTQELCRCTYNKTLEQRKNSRESEYKNVGYFESKKMIPIWKTSKFELKNVHYQVLQEIVKRVDLAFQFFFRGVKNGKNPGYPRFKSYGTYDSITQTQTGFELIDNKLLLSKIGEFKIKLYRHFDGGIIRLNIQRYPSGKWFVSFLIDTEAPNAIHLSGQPVGVDVGIKSFLTLSDGRYIPNPRFFATEEKALAKAQRKHSKAEKGTPEQKKALKVVQRIHEMIEI